MKIFIDAGHNDSGWDTGAAGFGLREQDITYSIAQKTGAILAGKYGVEVGYSRPTKGTILGQDVPTSLTKRANLSDEFNADLCVSIHCNAGGGTGTEVFAMTNGEGGKVAVKVLQSLVGMGLKSRGVKSGANLYMVRRPKAPAILVETAFIDTQPNNDWLRDRQDGFAMAIAVGIANYYGLEKKGEEMINYDDFKANMDRYRQELAGKGSTLEDFDPAEAMGITDGQRPQDLCTRQEAAVMIKRAIDKIR